MNNKSIIYKLIALLMAAFILFSIVACGENEDDENNALQRGTIIGDVPYMNVARVEFVKLAYNFSFTSCASNVEYEFKIKEVINIRRESSKVNEGETLNFVCTVDHIKWLKEKGYVYEEGKEYVIVFLESNWDSVCYIPLYDLDKCCELIKGDSEYFGFSLDVPPDEFVCELKEVIVTLKAYYNGELSELPFPKNDKNQ